MMSNQAETALSGVALFDAQYVYSAILSKIAHRDIVYIHVQCIYTDDVQPGRNCTVWSCTL